MDRERVRWACRRGMLELDLFLVPFFEKCFDSLSEDEKLHFAGLLGKSDPELLALLMDDKAPDNMDMVQLVEKIRQFKLQQGPHSLF